MNSSGTSHSYGLTSDEVTFLTNPVMFFQQYNFPKKQIVYKAYDVALIDWFTALVETLEYVPSNDEYILEQLDNLFFSLNYFVAGKHPTKFSKELANYIAKAKLKVNDNSTKLMEFHDVIYSLQNAIHSETNVNTDHEVQNFVWIIHSIINPDSITRNEAISILNKNEILQQAMSYSGAGMDAS